MINSLAPGGPRCHFKTAIFNRVLLIGIFTSSKDNALRWMPRDPTDDKSTLVQVMAWCRQATSHYLSQCWPRSVSPYGVTRPHQKCNRVQSSLTILYTYMYVEHEDINIHLNTSAFFTFCAISKIIRPWKSGMEIGKAHVANFSLKYMIYAVVL